jgi:pimeloyl-ACP methyl ester carboxylesterase
MRTLFHLSAFLLIFSTGIQAQNVFSYTDPIVRYDGSQALGSAQRPNPATPGLQKWVSTPTTGVTVGSSTIDVTSFKQYFINFNGTPMAFRMKFPKSYLDSAGKKYPVMIFLHGAGEVGCSTNNGVYNNEKQLWLGGGLFRDFVDQNLFDGFLLYPQLVNTDGCWGAWGSTTTANFAAVVGMLDSMSKYVRADVDRVMVNGLSGGGYGAWRFADAFPQRITKIIPSAAAGNTTNRANFVHIPIWFATGGKDPDPTPAQADYVLGRMKEIGADIRYTRYQDLGHSVWYRHWREPDYPAAMNDMHKANPLVFFQHNEFCANETIAARLGITQGFYAYEWQKDGVTIATRTSTTNVIVKPEFVTSFTGNEIVVKSFGTYSVRFKRTITSAWSVFSPKPVVVKQKTITQTPPITVSGAKSNVLPALDGSTTVPLQLPAGFLNYEWYRVSDNSLVGSTQIYNAPVGEYKARYSEQFGCGTQFSPNFIVVNAGGSPKPEDPAKLIATPATQTSIKLTWTQGAGETGFEIYRGTSSGGPYQFVSLNPVDAVAFTDTGLIANQAYYYIMRAVNATGASGKTAETTAKTLSDVSFPTAPANLQYRGSTSTTVSLKWSPGSDNGGIKRYDIYANGTKMFSTVNTSFTVYNLDSLKTYNFIVKAVDNSENPSQPSNQVTGYTHRRGINFKYYKTTASWSVIPDFTALAPTSTGTTDSVNVNNTSINPATLQFGFVWEGMIYIPVTASYTFETKSDDGSKLYIDVPYTKTAVPLVANDSIHGMRSRYGTKTLTEGYHSIAITYFQKANGFGLELYWTNNAGLLREKIPQNFFTFLNASVVAAPSVPAGLTATPLSYNQIRLNWTDNSTNESAFELVRSLTTTGTFVPVGTIGANAITFTDSGLLANKTYYYKIRAVSAGSESQYSAIVSATTQAASPLVNAPNPLRAFAGANNSISLNWQDNAINEWNYRVYRSTNGTTYTALASLTGNTNAYTDLTPVSQTSYYYYVQGYNGSGLGPKSNIVKIKAGNLAPVINSLTGMFAKTGTTVTADFTITDEPGDIVTAKILNKPAFLTLANTSGTSYRLTATPTQDNVGQYTITIQASDNNDKSSTGELVVTVADYKTKSVFLNFGETAKTAQLPWNNWTGIRAAGNVISNLKDENNVATTFSVTTVNAWSTTTVLGHISGNNSGIIPDAVLESGIADNGVAKQIRVGGLSSAKTYNLEFIGSQNEGLVATAQYAAGSQISVLDARYNTTRSANLNGLVPDATGQILVTITRTGTSAYTYLNGMIIEEADPSITLLNPEHLYAEPLDRNRVSLTWTDRTNNEAAADGYEIQRANDSLFTQNVTLIPSPANTTEYIDPSLAPNTKFWYRVRAKNGAVYSEYSNKFTTVTPASIVYINFNTTVPDAAAPWNNMAASPLNEFIVDNLYNQSGGLSGLSFAVTKVFNGEFTAGLSTGNNSGVVPDNVLMSDFWLDNTQQSQVKLSGFNHTRRYRIGFVGSSSINGWFKGNYTASYTVNGRTVYLNSWMNSTKVVYISDIVPNASGEIFIDFSTTAIAQWGFNAGIIVQEYTDPKGGSVLYMSNSALDSADNLAAVPVDKYKVHVYPNPFNNVMNLDFYNPAAGNKITAEVYDVNGRLVHRQHYEQISAGHNTLRVGYLPSSKNGIYVVALKINGRIVEAVKMVKK